MDGERVAPPPAWAYNYSESVRSRVQRVKRGANKNFWDADIRMGLEQYRRVSAAKSRLLLLWQRHQAIMGEERFKASPLWRRLK